MPPPFGGGEDGSPLFPSPPQDGKAIYGLRTWSFGSDSGGGGSGGGGGDEQAPWKPSAASPSATKQQVYISKGKQFCACSRFDSVGIGDSNMDVSNMGIICVQSILQYAFSVANEYPSVVGK